MSRIVFSLLALSLLLSQCAPVYIPNARNTPLFTKAGEVQSTMQLGTTGIDLQGAVAVTNYLALMGNFSYGNRSNNGSDINSDTYQKHNFYEGALGYYKNDGQFCFEVFLGYGQGEASSLGDYYIFSSSSGRDLAKGRYSRFFFQPSFGFNKKIVHLAFTPRISWVDFSEFQGPSVLQVDLDPALFVEPAVTAKFNFFDNRLFGTLQLGFSTQLTGNVIYEYEAFMMTTGLGFRIGGLHWTESKKEPKPQKETKPQKEVKTAKESEPHQD